MDWAADTPRKVIARTMVNMVATINKNNFGGRAAVTCWTCHRNRDKPLVTPALETIYGEPTFVSDDVVAQLLDCPPRSRFLISTSRQPGVPSAWPA